MWQWKNQRPGLSALNSIRTVWFGPTLTVCLRGAEGAVVGEHPEEVPVQVVLAVPARTCASHIAREDPSEPIFAQRSFIERNVELDLGVVRNADDATALTTTLGATWVFARRVQLGLEVPGTARFPHAGASQAALDDVTVSTQLLLCCQMPSGWRFLSLRADVAAPTGDRSRGIGGTGETSVSLLAGNGFTVVRSLEDLGVQVELAWARELRLSDAERKTARRLGWPERRAQDVVWNLALTQPLLGRRLTPVLELLGTTTVAAVDSGDEGTAVALGVGLWTAPFPDDSVLSPLSLAVGWRAPVTSRRDDDGAALVIAEWAFD